MRRPRAGGKQLFEPRSWLTELRLYSAFIRVGYLSASMFRKLSTRLTVLYAALFGAVLAALGISSLAVVAGACLSRSKFK